MSKASEWVKWHTFTGRASGMIFGERKNRELGHVIENDNGEAMLETYAKRVPRDTAVAYAHWILDTFE